MDGDHANSFFHVLSNFVSYRNQILVYGIETLRKRKKKKKNRGHENKSLGHCKHFSELTFRQVFTLIRGTDFHLAFSHFKYELSVGHTDFPSVRQWSYVFHWKVSLGTKSFEGAFSYPAHQRSPLAHQQKHKTVWPFSCAVSLLSWLCFRRICFRVIMF